MILVRIYLFFIRITKVYTNKKNGTIVKMIEMIILQFKFFIQFIYFFYSILILCRDNLRLSVTAGTEAAED